MLMIVKLRFLKAYINILFLAKKNLDLVKIFFLRNIRFVRDI